MVVASPVMPLSMVMRGDSSTTAVLQIFMLITCSMIIMTKRWLTYYDYQVLNSDGLNRRIATVVLWNLQVGGCTEACQETEENDDESSDDDNYDDSDNDGDGDGNYDEMMTVARR
ncbi:hypothetical protein PIB30_054913 [Stylosanthes scabra]|uniref:Uncharacterized protein n=1 Tax=Stylosanthes scabra TaxID=79078 RepID=A0ABU6UIE2_9FABA|nr:hypothetical protein [Stylosanthes scabra]